MKLKQLRNAHVEHYNSSSEHQASAITPSAETCGLQREKFRLDEETSSHTAHVDHPDSLLAAHSRQCEARCLSPYLYTSMHTQTQSRTHAHTYAHVHTHACTHTHTLTHTGHSHWQQTMWGTLPFSLSLQHARTQSRTHARTHSRTCTRMRKHTHTHIHTHAGHSHWQQATWGMLPFSFLLQHLQVNLC